VAAPQARLQVEAVGGRAERALGHGPLVGVEHDADRLALAEQAQNALADSLDELLDLFLAGGWRGVEYPAVAVPVVAVDAVEE